MLIGELMELIESGERVADIAKTIDGLGEKKLRQALKNAGYDFKNSGQKGWFYIAEGEEPLEKSIFDYVENKRFNVDVITKSNNEIQEVNPTSVAVITKSNKGLPVRNPFTAQEIEALKTLANDFITYGNSSVIKNKISSIEKADRVRKTFHVSSSLINRFDDLSEKHNISKSDLLELALLDLLERYQ